MSAPRSRRSFLRLLTGAAAAGSAAALSAACEAPTAPAAQPSPIAAAPTPAATAPPTVAPTVAPTEIPALKIGVLLPYTESSIGVDIGLNQKRAADLYLKQHGGKLGGRMVNLVYSAESIEAGINKTKVRTLTETEHVELLMGGASSDTAQVIRDAAEALKMVYIATNASANALSQSKYVFRTSASAWQLSEPLGEWMLKSGKQAFCLCGVDDTFGSESMDAFAAGLARNGGAVSHRSSVPTGGDWASVVASITAQPSRDVFAAFATDDAQGLLTEWLKQGAADAGYQLYGPGPLTDEEVLASVQPAATGVTSSLFWSPDLDNAENKALVDAFPKEYTDDDTGQPVSLSGYAVQMWDAMSALDLALQQTGGVASTSVSDALIAALEGVSLKSPRGNFTFDRVTHNPIQDILIRQVQLSPVGKPVNAILATIPSAAVTFGPVSVTTLPTQ